MIIYIFRVKSFPFHFLMHNSCAYFVRARIYRNRFHTHKPAHRSLCESRMLNVSFVNWLQAKYNSCINRWDTIKEYIYAYCVKCMNPMIIRLVPLDICIRLMRVSHTLVISQLQENGKSEHIFFSTFIRWCTCFFFILFILSWQIQSGK